MHTDIIAHLHALPRPVILRSHSLERVPAVIFPKTKKADHVTDLTSLLFALYHESFDMVLKIGLQPGPSVAQQLRVLQYMLCLLHMLLVLVVVLVAVLLLGIPTGRKSGSSEAQGLKGWVTRRSARMESAEAKDERPASGAEH
eukprot:3146454-Rhodomonas_salina.2